MKCLDSFITAKKINESLNDDNRLLDYKNIINESKVQEKN